MEIVVKKKECYEAPVIETIEVKVEQGFEVSLPTPEESKSDSEYTW